MEPPDLNKTRATKVGPNASGCRKGKETDFYFFRPATVLK